MSKYEFLGSIIFLLGTVVVGVLAYVMGHLQGIWSTIELLDDISKQPKPTPEPPCPACGNGCSCVKVAKP